jgi:Mg2+-importing ATPase
MPTRTSCLAPFPTARFAPGAAASAFLSCRTYTSTGVHTQFLNFFPRPPLYWLFLAIMLLGYAILTQLVKTWFIRRFSE